MSSSCQRPAPLAIAQHFASLEDPRVVGRSIHPLLNILIMALVGVFCGANGWEDMEEIALDKKDWLATFLDMSFGVPSADTFRRVLCAIRPETLVACIQSWIQSLAKPLGGQVVAFDGKTIRGALLRNPWAQSLHLVHVWACQQKLLLAQTAVRGAPEESEAVRRLLELMELRGAIATGDAAHCSVQTAACILGAGADYLLHLKGNRAALHKKVETFFFKAQREGFSPKMRHRRTCEKGHGRLETRETWTVPAEDLVLPGVTWPQLRSITLIRRTREIKGEQSVERHYFLSSLPPVARRIEESVREHWQVENGLHWSLDVQMGEDECAVHDELGAQNLASLRRLTLMMLKRDTRLKKGIEAKRAKAARNTEYLEHLITLGNG